MLSLLDDDDVPQAAAPAVAPSPLIDKTYPDMGPNEAIMATRPQPDHCEKIFSDPPGLRGCSRPVAYQAEQTGVYLCAECAHEARKRNLAINRHITFRKVKIE